jgi:hypothetical protein
MEWYPAPPMFIGAFGVLPGDEIQVYVTVWNNGLGASFWIGDSNGGQYGNWALSSPNGVPAQGSAECIAEAPGGPPTTPLDDFSPVTFSQCVAWDNSWNIITPFGNWSYTNAILVNLFGSALLAVPSPLNTGAWGGEITVTRVNPSTYQ